MSDNDSSDSVTWGAERRQFVRFSVQWKARIMLSDRSLYQVTVIDASKGGVAIEFDRVLSKNTPVNIEIVVNAAAGDMRFRAKTVVCHNTVLSSGSAKLGLRFTEMGHDEMHAYNNMLQRIQNRNT